jgi:hypothetical protein
VVSPYGDEKREEETIIDEKIHMPTNLPKKPFLGNLPYGPVGGAF